MAASTVNFQKLEQLATDEHVAEFLQELARVMSAARSNFKVLLGGLSAILFTKVTAHPHTRLIILPLHHPLPASHPA